MKKYYAVMFEDSSVADVVASSREEALESAMAAPGAPSCMAIQATLVGFVPPHIAHYSTIEGRRLDQFTWTAPGHQDVHVWIPQTPDGFGILGPAIVHVEAYGLYQPGVLHIYGTKIPVVLQKDGDVGVHGYTCTYEQFAKEGVIDVSAPVKFIGADGSTTQFLMED